MSADTIECEGEVVRVHRGDTYEVQVVIGALRRTVLAKRSGRLNQARIKLVAGDRVKLELGAYDLGKGRIVYRVG